MHETANRLGFAGALRCTLRRFSSFGVGFTYILHLLNWSHRPCRYAGQDFLLPGSLQFLSHTRPISIMNFLLCQWVLASDIARKIGFPEMTDEEATGPEWLLMMFRK
jgi:hypothetical protein